MKTGMEKPEWEREKRKFLFLLSQLRWTHGIISLYHNFSFSL